MSSERNIVGWFEIYVQDMARAKKFYESTFHVTLQNLPNPGLEMWAFPIDPEKPGAAGALVRFEGKDPGPGGVIIYFGCEDCAETAALAIENGGRMQKEKMSIGDYGFISLVYDTEGTMIGLHSMR